MIQRIGSAAVLIVAIASFASSPSWGAATTAIAALIAYTVFEIAERSVHIARHARVEKEVEDLKKRVEAVEVAHAATKEVVGVLKKRHDEKQREIEDRLKNSLKGFGGIGT